jgi:hypothetical protein
VTQIPVSKLPTWMIDHPRGLERRYDSPASVAKSIVNQTTGIAEVGDGSLSAGPNAPTFPAITFGWGADPSPQFAELDEYFNQDPFGYVGGLDQSSSLWGYPNYVGCTFRLTEAMTWTAGAQFGISLGRVKRVSPTADLNNIGCGIFYDLFNSKWKAWFNNKWDAIGGNRYIEEDLGADGRVGAVAPTAASTVHHRVEVFYNPGIEVVYAINGKPAYVLKDINVQPRNPLKDAYTNRNQVSSTAAGLVVHFRSGTGAVTSSHLNVLNVKATTIPRES